ncbi:F0F1 ATP synthase subunit epsilon [Arsenicitalea aurantiaca]|uniref:ATP synthase epsilon chain n=1 Tax=Arsenicitalea aurantiaca TaxID=1783274 RepID=A0A433X7G5_9HYPH|nr:F0F1 ATP synthase subunit epsilon [Arsenicitalea aurantiaca]RUT30016.1 F0F1 ATP synthase subunit epsilon [Arsenicitalea aurantiaca]
MAEGIKLEIVSPEKLVLSEDVRSVTVPGAEGYFTVLGDHAPMMSTLRPGFVTIVGLDGRSDHFYVRSGFADVSNAGITILAEAASSLADFDRAGIVAELEKARADLAGIEDHEQRNFVQDVINGLSNLMVEAENLNQSHVH